MSSFGTRWRAPDEPPGGSAAGNEAKEQGMSGRQGGPRASRDDGGEGQPPQGSRRVENAHAAETRTGFEPGHAPSEQGRGAPKPDTIAEHQQGMEARSGSRGAHEERSEEISARGEPQGEHASHGRHDLPADR